VEDDTPPFRVISNVEVGVYLLLACAAYLALTFGDHLGFAKATAAGVGVISFCAGTSWPLRRHRWFWGTAAFLVIVHLSALYFVDWSRAAKWMGLTIMPLMAADTLITLGIVYIAFRLFCGRPPRLFAPRGAQRYTDQADF
jgi:hypothetical protein